MQVSTIYKLIGKVAKREKEPAWIKYLKQWRPKKKGSAEFELKNVAPRKYTRPVRRGELAKELGISHLLNHLTFQDRQRKIRPTMHEMPAPARLYRKPITNAELLSGLPANKKQETKLAIREGDRNLLIYFGFPGYR